MKDNQNRKLQTSVFLTNNLEIDSSCITDINLVIFTFDLCTVRTNSRKIEKKRRNLTKPDRWKISTFNGYWMDASKQNEMLFFCFVLFFYI